MNATQEPRLTYWEAISLMVGAGVGAGIMAVPYLAQRVGLVGLALILLIAWTAIVLVHLMLAEVLFRTGRPFQIVELMRLYVLYGRVGQWLLWTIFALLSVAFMANLAAYISGAAEIVASLMSLDRSLAEVLVYVVTAVRYSLRNNSRAGAKLLDVFVLSVVEDEGRSMLYRPDRWIGSARLALPISTQEPLL